VPGREQGQSVINVESTSKRTNQNGINQILNQENSMQRITYVNNGFKKTVIVMNEET